jgi:hypothetical protein
MKSLEFLEIDLLIMKIECGCWIKLEKQLEPHSELSLILYLRVLTLIKMEKLKLLMNSEVYFGVIFILNMVWLIDHIKKLKIK